jgi:hypothetical protein
MWDQSRRSGKVMVGRTTDDTLRLANEIIDEDLLRKCRLVPKGEEPWTIDEYYQVGSFINTRNP